MSIAFLENPAIRNRVLPLSVAQYHCLNKLGLANQKTELIQGVMIEKMSKSPLHTYLLTLLHHFFQTQLPAGYWIRKEDPMTFIDSEPEPDISVVKGQFSDFRAIHPNYAELIIEVAVSSYGIDREKAIIYAMAGIPEYWIVLPANRQIEVYRQPSMTGYMQINRYGVNEILTTINGLKLPLNTVFSDHG